MKNPIIIASFTTLILLGCGSMRTANKQRANNSPTTDTLKAKDSSIVNKYWKLIMLEGKKVSMVKNQEREAYFILRSEQNSVTGFAGCNTFNGTYTLTEGWRIRFSQMATTLMACPDVNVNEGEFLKVFELADNYTIHSDTLSLNVGRRAPLAVFEAVYFH